MNTAEGERYMQIDRRQFLQAGTGALAAGLAAPAIAQSAYPNKPIKLLVPYVPGSPVDVLARVVSKQVSEALGQPITIENRPGAGAVIATKLVVSAPPDGYTLLMSGQTLTYLADFYPDLGFDPVKSVTPVATLAGWSHVLVINPSLPVKTIAEFVKLAKDKPGTMNFGFGIGTSPQILGEYFKLVAGLDIVSVPYKGGEEVRIDLIGGRIQMNFAPYGNVRAMIQEGQVRPIAVTSSRRIAALPDVPTMTEAGFPQVGFDPDIWQAIVAPVGTPQPIVDKLNTVINESLRLPEVREIFDKLTYDPMVKSQEEFAKFLAVQAERWPPVIKAANIKPQ